MARVTIEDCIEYVGNNPYELVGVAAQRAKEIASGVPPTVSVDNDKNAVIALREIAQQNLNIDILRKMIVRGTKYKLDEALREIGSGIDQVRVDTESKSIETDIYGGETIEEDLGD